MFDLVEANLARLQPWMPWSHVNSLESVRAFIGRVRQEAANNMGLTLVVVRDGRLAGTGGFNRIDWANRTGYIGYWLAREAEGEGIVTAMVNALADHAFGVWKLHRLDLRAGVENTRSRAVAERCGFTLEGVMRDAELVGDRWISHAVYSRLAVDRD
jgi:ribosomal-protein-serine acetyltransferase